MSASRQLFVFYVRVRSQNSFPFCLHMTSKPGFNVPKHCVVTGGSGFVGQRLVEMLVERGASRVVSFDKMPKPKGASDSPKIVYVEGDLTKPDDVFNAFAGCDCAFHIAALVGPYFPSEAYVKVNYEGTLNVLNACKKHGIKKLVMSSSPSTRFPYPDPNVEGLTEEELFTKVETLRTCTVSNISNSSKTEWRRFYTSIFATICRNKSDGRESCSRRLRKRRLAHHCSCTASSVRPQGSIVPAQLVRNCSIRKAQNLWRW